jgi:hypothetical protein
MKKQRMFWALAMTIGLFLGITLSAGQAMAAGTMGDVINALAVSLNMPAADLCVILYKGGCPGAAPATEANISQLYLAVNNAIIGGQLSGNATTLVTDAAATAGVSSDTITAGITTGTALSAAAGSSGGGGSPGGGGGATGGGGGGGGGAISPSR